MTDEGEALTLRVHTHLARQSLPANQFAPAKLTIEAGFQSGRPALQPSPPQRLSDLRLLLNHHVKFETAGLPRCPLSALRGATAQEAQSRCGNAEVGKGIARWPIRCSGTRCRRAIGARFHLDAAAIPTDVLVAFNGRFGGVPAILVQGTGYEGRGDFVLVFVSERAAPGRTVFVADASPSEHPPDSITGISLSLGRRYRLNGKPRAFLTASCPSDNLGEFALGSLEFGFADGSEVSEGLTSKCGANP